MKQSGLVVLISLAFITLATVFTMAQTPRQPYKELGKKGMIEFRFYPEAMMASVTSNDATYRGSSGKNFRVLAGYIFGNNQRKEKIEMTAPVHMAFGNGQSTMSFVMPQGYTLSNLPKPASGDVQLHPSPEEYVAVIRFGGWASDATIETKKQELAAALAALGITHHHHFRFLGYNAPWDILSRRNEVMVSIDKNKVPAF